MALSDFPRFIRKNYDVHEWQHASAVLRTVVLRSAAGLCSRFTATTNCALLKSIGTLANLQVTPSTQESC